MPICMTTISFKTMPSARDISVLRRQELHPERFSSLSVRTLKLSSRCRESSTLSELSFFPSFADPAACSLQGKRSRSWIHDSGNPRYCMSKIVNDEGQEQLHPKPVNTFRLLRSRSVTERRQQDATAGSGKDCCNRRSRDAVPVGREGPWRLP